MSEQETFPVPAEWGERAHADKAEYEFLYGRSLADPGTFWLEQARTLDWIKRPKISGDWSFDASDFHISWFTDGQLNVSANCIDRHLADRGNDIAIIWEPDDPAQDPRRFTYRQLHSEVCRFANVLKQEGVRRGSRVTIYMPMIPEAAFALLACARIGAIHSVVFGGFSPEALAGRITDCDSTCNHCRRRPAGWQDGRAQGQCRQGGRACHLPEEGHHDPGDGRRCCDDGRPRYLVSRGR